MDSVVFVFAPFTSDGQHLSYDGCLEVRGEIIRTVLCHIVYWSCAVINTLRWAVLTVLWIAFCLTGPMSLGPARVCLDSFVFMFVLSCHTAYVLYYSNTVGWTWWDWSLILTSFLQCLTLLVGSFDPLKTVLDMTYNVFGGTLNPTQPTAVVFSSRVLFAEHCFTFCNKIVQWFTSVGVWLIVLLIGKCVF